MGLISTITDKIRGEYRPAREILDWEQSAMDRASHFQRLYDYYVGSEAEIQDHVKLAMNKTFKAGTIAKMQIPYLNIVRRIIDRLAMVYKTPAIRYIEPDETNPNYQTLLEQSNINYQCKIWHRLAKLLDTVYVQAVWRKDHIEYEIFPPHLLRVRENPDNYLIPDEVMYSVAAGKDTYYVIWTESEHWILNDQGRPIEGKNPWGGVNRYGILPMWPLRLREVEDHWGEGDTQLVDINEKIDILLASTYYNAVMQSHGQAIAVNFDFDENTEIQTGPDKIIQVKNVTKDMVMPDFRFVQPQPAIRECVEKIDWLTRTAAMMRGLPASSVSTKDAISESGSGKIVDNWELLELRADDIEYLRPFEKKLFEISRKVWNFHCSSELRIDPEANFLVDFPLPVAPVTELEELESKQIKYKLGLWTPVDDMIDEDEGIDKDAALEMVKENLEIRKELSTIINPAYETPPRPTSDDGTQLGPRNWTETDKRRDSRGYNPEPERINSE